MSGRPRFFCPQCDYPFRLRDNGGVPCPACGGLGIDETDCTCPEWVEANVPRGRYPCPLHEGTGETRPATVDEAVEDWFGSGLD